MTSYNFGEVVLVPFPFTDQTTNKKRPAVVISSEIYNAEYPDRILMSITSQVFSSQKVGDIIINDLIERSRFYEKGNVTNVDNITNFAWS